MVFKRQCESNQSQPIISINSDSVEWPKKWIWMLVWLARTVWAKTSSSHTIKSPNKLNPNTEKIELTTILIDVCGIVWHYCMHRYKPPLLPQRIKWEKKKKMTDVLHILLICVSVTKVHNLKKPSALALTIVGCCADRGERRGLKRRQPTVLLWGCSTVVFSW